ncbi:MAG: IS256 family transposase [Candidatus Omnitrophica bacterium]|nr:IS256 family transposase [Candidatus Omnitrophota bacterium]
MQRDYNAYLEKSVLDLLQYSKSERVVDDLLIIVFETMLKAEQKGFLGYGYGESPDEENKRNGYRRSSLLKGLSGMFRLNIPRDRMGLFKPMFLELLKDQTDKINEVAFKLYVKGLSTKEISDVVQDIYGKNVSKATISNITNEMLVEVDKWQNKRLENEYYAVYIDAIRVPIRRDSVSKECFYVVLGLRTDLKREILGIYQIPEEHYQGWEEVLEDLRRRGLQNTIMFITDELKEIEQAISTKYPRSCIQRCITHKKRNILRKVRIQDKREIMHDFNKVLSMNEPMDTIEKAVGRLDIFIEKWARIYPSIKRMFARKREYFNYIRFPYLMRRMVYTNNWIENLNRQIKRTTKIRGSFPNPRSAEKLVVLKCIELEENYMKYPVTAILPAQERLDEMLNNIKQPVLETHNT